MTRDILKEIQDQVNKDDVVLYIKGNKLMPQCGFSATALHILQQCGVSFKDYNVLADAELREGIKRFADWPTIPQLYVKGEFIGGCDIMREMFAKGELQELFKAKLSG